MRSYSLREEPIPGFEAQADFGQYVIKDMYGINRRIYMFCMVLSYSRMRFCYFSANPFTAKTAIEAHEYAFRYFGGRPQHILYDQDRVFVISEMFGEYKLVKEFEEYVRFRGFTVQLCHKWDPDSKGKVETTVKAIKRGFLDGRIYAGIDSLNSDCLIWLDNIGNGDINFTTRKIPRDMFIEESKHLQKVNFYKKKHDTILTVESTNSVVYKGNQYQLPKEELLAGGRVKVVEEDGILIFYRPFSTEPICKLEVSTGIGHIITAKKGTYENVEKIQFLKFFNNDKIIKDYIDKVDSTFLAPNVRLRQYKRMCKLTRYYNSEELLEGIKFCIKKKTTEFLI